uniref:Transmembrane protein 5 n=1 Tax=Lygus hesperus TaxID=30085 RepID=A0A146KX82_LYGHE
MLKKVLIIIVISGTLSYLSTLYYYVDQDRLHRTFCAPGKIKTLHKTTVHVVGKAAIADFLWLHILEGTLTDEADGLYQTGSIETDGFIFKFLSGPGYIQTTIPQDIEYLVLILNGRSDEKKQAALLWLEYLNVLPHLKRVGIVLLGDEKCRNDWILKYLRKHGGIVDVLFVVYDWKLVDNKDIFQWPLGVATYRRFPAVKDLKITDSPRKHFCNFVGTVYKNSSRSHLKQMIMDRQFPFSCVSYVREKWLPNETTESLLRYINILKNSDFTLCPVGRNTECYRIYEALSFGSIPVIEDVVTDGQCSSPLRLLKEYNAPFVYLDNWGHLSSSLGNLTDKWRQVAKLRNQNVSWYKSFKLLIRG